MGVIAQPMTKALAVGILRRIAGDIENGAITEGSIEFGPGVEFGVPTSANDFQLGGLLRHSDNTLEMIGNPEF
jgi:hypothetical protein